jgi:redox-sensitive bicupin YhaK (pirin superfamily)
MVGPFTFFDHLGPAVFAAGSGIDVRPHPHIHLATVTYLFEGELLHRDSLGTEQLIRPGAINWMTAGHGIVHSERTPAEARTQAFRMHGLQLWVALPSAHEDDAPSFRHYDAPCLPRIDDTGIQIRVLAGTAFGHSSPVETLSALFYVEVRLDTGHQLHMPNDYEERALYVVDGEVECAGQRLRRHQMAVAQPQSEVTVRAVSASHFVWLGGAPLDGKRYMSWNFVSSSAERIERAKLDWKSGRFPKVPGDDHEFIPLPE